MQNLFLLIDGNETTTAQEKADSGQQNLDDVIRGLSPTGGTSDLQLGQLSLLMLGKSWAMPVLYNTTMQL